ncbi:MAG: transporter permease [Candidatus Saccharibacteria bacterium]|nr:transporter permease [Candidatus Saccharibacteria bacterium]
MAVQLEFQRRSKLLSTITDSLIMVKRSSTHILRNTDQLLGTFFQPIMFLVLFAAVFGKSIEATLPPGVSYLNFLLAGIIVQTVAFGSTTTAIAVSNDLQKGIVDRFRSLPMSNLAVLNGHVISDLFRNGISTIIMILAGLILGFRSHASVLDWLAIVGLILLFTLAFSWLAAIVGVVAKSVEAVQWLSFIIVFPLTFASSAFVKADLLSGPLKVFAENQPITHIIEAIRALMLGTPLGDHGWLAVIWCLATMAVTIPLATRLFARKSS